MDIVNHLTIYIKDRLEDIGFNSNILNHYYEKERYYHNIDHISSMIKQAINEGILTDDLFLAIVYHDVIYNPLSLVNEEESAELFLNDIKQTPYFDEKSESPDYLKWVMSIHKAILETKTHKPTSTLSENLTRLDLNILYSDFYSFKDFEDKIRKEYSFVPTEIYKEKRLEILQELGVSIRYLNYIKNLYV